MTEVYFCRRQAGHRVGQHLERIVPLIVKFCQVEDDELREYCLQAFESFVRRCPKEISPHINTVCMIMSTPRRVGTTYCFTDVGFCIGNGVLLHVTPITKEPLLKFFLGGTFLFPRALAFDFCYDPEICSQSQAVRAFFIGMRFSQMVSKVQGETS